MEVSSANSRLAPSRRSSPSVMIPFGIDHAPSSFLAQNGPPGCTRKTSRPLPERRYIKSPALVCGIAEFPLLCPALQFEGLEELLKGSYRILEKQTTS